MKFLFLLATLLFLGGIVNAQLVVKTGNDGVVYSPQPLTTVSQVITTPVFSGAATGTLDLSSVTLTLPSAQTLTSGTLASPTVTGTLSGSYTRSGTATGGTYAAPVFSGTQSGIVAVGGTMSVIGQFLHLSGTAGNAVTGAIALSSTNLLFYDGAGWRRLDN